MVGVVFTMLEFGPFLSGKRLKGFQDDCRGFVGVQNYQKPSNMVRVVNFLKCPQAKKMNLASSSVDKLGEKVMLGKSSWGG